LNGGKKVKISFRKILTDWVYECNDCNNVSSDTKESKRIWEKNGCPNCSGDNFSKLYDLVAVFKDDFGELESYMHVGQHSDASNSFVKECTTESDITIDCHGDLKKELESIGYDVEKVNYEDL